MFSDIKKIIGYATSLQNAAEKQKENHGPRKGFANVSRVKNDPHPCKLHRTGLALRKKADSHPVGATGIPVSPIPLSERKTGQKQMLQHGQRHVLERQAPGTTSLDRHDNNKPQLIGQGSRGRVYRSGDMIIKEVTPFNPGAARHEVDMCNSYWQTAGESAVATRAGNCIRMPFVQGKSPNSSETRQVVKGLYDKGFMMGDAHPSNFIKTEKGDIVPVDFGLVFPKDGVEQLHKDVGKEILRDYAKGGFHYVPDEIKPAYTARLQALDRLLGKESPTYSMTTEQLSKLGIVLDFPSEAELQAD
ncbi:hypothetical protein PHLH7_28640 [Pseudomonas sp. Ost2]|uniref:Protein kinase domain-containing protein n=2 Tax=Pseudomonas gingeri TaxID=117681 RepID=A0A7Y8CDD4_9PSED|nr:MULTISPECIES: hypothetical protein [Pseudomonas]NWC13871.1 hypothetical protein [Pseudomonas gingeri]BBP76760.1 hypothetical protein PHLH7_28640 [Pseudomonas sp. Ost2]